MRIEFVNPPQRCCPQSAYATEPAVLGHLPGLPERTQIPSWTALLVKEFDGFPARAGSRTARGQNSVDLGSPMPANPPGHENGRSPRQ